jgi:hypothetical protein
MAKILQYVPEFLAIIIIPFLYLYRLTTYHWKGLEENYNFVIKKKNQLEFICKSYDHTKFQTHLALGKHDMLNYCVYYL